MNNQRNIAITFLLVSLNLHNASGINSPTETRRYNGGEHLKDGKQTGRYNGLRDFSKVDQFLGDFERQISGPQSCVALLTDNGLRCVANLISSQFIITSASCVTVLTTKGKGNMPFYSGQPADFFVRVGSMEALKGGSINYIWTIFIHPSYRFKPDVLEYRNVALLSLWWKEELGAGVSAAKLHSELTLSDFDYMAGSKCTVTGWGESENLITIEVTLISIETCMRMFSNKESVFDGLVHVCTMDRDVNLCNYRGGEALMCSNKILAIHSITSSCYPGLPVIYARVDNIKDFIEDSFMLAQALRCTYSFFLCHILGFILTYIK